MSDDLPALGAARLAPVVRAALGDPDALVLSWSQEPMGWAAINPSTKALHRLAGQARTGSGQVHSWVVVLKIVGDVDFSGHPLDRGYLHDPADWNYWRREALAFESGLLTDWPGPLRPVTCLGVENLDDRQAWIWLEAVDGARPRAAWTLTEYGAVAYDLGSFAAQATTATPDPSLYPWLAQRWPRGWLRSIRTVGLDHALEHDGCWTSPLLPGTLPANTQQRLRSIMDDAEPILEALESLPVTLAHHDPNLANMFRRPDAGTTVIDWGFLGLAPVGVDLGLFIAGNLARMPDSAPAAERDALATNAYLRGLRDHGWSGDETSVRFARAASAALVTLAYYGLQASLLCPEYEPWLGEDAATWPADLAATQQVSVEEAMLQWAASLQYLLDLGLTARTRAGSLTLGHEPT